MSIEYTKVEGRNTGDIKLYALSTCGWCRKVKMLLNDLGVEYDYIDVDLLGGDDKGKVVKEVERWNPRCTFPTLVINNDKCVVGYKEDQIRDALGT
jgi:glutaredoxin-like protein NrdH